MRFRDLGFLGLLLAAHMAVFISDARLQPYDQAPDELSTIQPSPAESSPLDAPDNAEDEQVEDQPSADEIELAPTAPSEPVREAENAGALEDPYDAPNLATQYRMADATEQLVEVAWLQLWASTGAGLLLLATLVFTAVAAIAARRSANAASDSAATADRNLRANQRPWVSVSVNVASSWSAGENEWRISFEFVLTNVGTTPALNAMITATVHPLTPKLQEEIARAPDSAKQNPDLFRSTVGNTIFPGQSVTERRSIPLRKYDIEEYSKIWA